MVGHTCVVESPEYLLRGQPAVVAPGLFRFLLLPMFICCKLVFQHSPDAVLMFCSYGQDGCFVSGKGILVHGVDWWPEVGGYCRFFA